MAPAKIPGHHVSPFVSNPATETALPAKLAKTDAPV